MQTENNSNTVALKKDQFTITIHASKEKVWKVLWDDETFRAWTSVFSEGSHAVSDWNEGSKILFLDGKGSGMNSLIAKKIPVDFMSFKHIGEVKNGVEQPMDEKTNSWSGSYENYTLKETNGSTELTVEMDTTDDYRDYFNETFPKALQKLKELAEEKTKITIEALIKAPVEKVWEFWTVPGHIIKWNNASEDWHTPRAENDLREGGKFLARMEAKDSSFGFDFGGIYNEVKTNELITYTLDDGRKVRITFSGAGNETKVVETFEAEATNPIEMQRGGWQAILNNFKSYAESN